MNRPLVGALLCTSVAAFGDPRLPIDLNVQSCPGLREAEIRRIIFVELRALLSEQPDAAAGAPRVRATVTCGGQLARLRVEDPDDPRGNAIVTRDLDLPNAMPEARARLVALATVELISSLWSERDAAPPATVPPPTQVALPIAVPTAPGIAAAVPPPRSSAWTSRTHVALAASAMRFSENPSALTGVDASVGRDIGPWLGWAIDVQDHYGVRGDSQDVYAGSVASHVLGLGVAAVAHHTWSHVEGELGAGVRGGAARLAGVPGAMTYDAMGTVSWAPWFGVFGRAGARVALTGNLSLDATAELGGVLSPVAALLDPSRSASDEVVGGVWVQLQLAVGMTL